MSFLYDQQGKRKYLTIEERNAFLRAARQCKPEVYTFCCALAYTGGRLSEILSLVPARVDLHAGVIIIESLKKRRKGIFRAIPVPPSFLKELDSIHYLKDRQCNTADASQKIWPWCRTTAWKKVKLVMNIVSLTGVHASPKGLRHSFAVGALETGLPINLVKKWLGHSRLETTAIYADAVGNEERKIANKLWKSFNTEN